MNDDIYRDKINHFQRDKKTGYSRLISIKFNIIKKVCNSFLLLDSTFIQINVIKLHNPTLSSLYFEVFYNSVFIVI